MAGNYSDDDEMNMLRDAARRFLAGNWPAERAVSSSGKPEELRRIWGEMGSQGWLALGSQDGEAGMRMVSILLQELGRAAFPAPLLDAFIANVVLCQLARPHNGMRELAGEIREGRAVISCALGPLDGDANAGAFEVTGSGEAILVCGRASFVEGTSLATHFLVITGRPNEMALVSVGDGVAITATPGLSVPPLAEVEFNGAKATALSGRDLRTLQAIARLGLVSRALGSATRGFDLVTEYAKVRVQFGKKIGQYQAIQHKLANCLMSLETSRLALLRAAAAFDSGGADWLYAAGTAFAIASPALRQVCLETHHAFGGVSFWEEHEMPRHFRRIHADLVRCGGVHGAREDMARYLLGEIG